MTSEQLKERARARKAYDKKNVKLSITRKWLQRILESTKEIGGKMRSLHMQTTPRNVKNDDSPTVDVAKCHAGPDLTS